MSNPFTVTPANPLAALMMGVQGYDQGKKIATENRRSTALQQLMGTGQAGGTPNYAGVANTLAAAGDLEGAGQLAVLNKNLAGPEQTDLIKNLNAENKTRTAQGLPALSPMDWHLASERAKASVTNVKINNAGETEFDKEFGKDQAKRWSGYLTTADAANKKAVDISNLREISGRIGSQGSTADAKEALGPYANALGIDINGLSDIQAYSSIIQRLAPQQRAPGSGSTSDVEFKGFLKSLPGASQHPAARAITIDTMEALNRDDIARGEIARKLATGEIKRHDAERQLRMLPDPLKSFSDWRKSNPQIYGQISKGGAAPASNPRVDDLLNKYAPKQ
jgi:hypothetical protein